jgi:DNA-binding XRE family transcriptional regulator
MQQICSRTAACQHAKGNLRIITAIFRGEMITRAQCRAARAGLEWRREDLADLAGLAVRTITDFERGARDPHDKRAIRSAFEAAGVRFTKDGCICLPEEEYAENGGQ